MDALLQKINKGAHGMTNAEQFYLQQRIQIQVESLARKERLHFPSTVDKGRTRENLAMVYLERKGYTLWERNYHCKEGEIDLIVNRETTIVFVEVKSRQSKKYGMPYEAVTKKKMRSLIRAAESYLYERDLLEGWNIRYDVISILALPGADPLIDHFEDAFRVDEVFGD